MATNIDIALTICYNYFVPLLAAAQKTYTNQKETGSAQERIRIMNKNKDLYKRFVTFISGILLLAMITGLFAFVWYRKYSAVIVLPYYRRGNWVLIAIYCLIVWLFF